MRILIASLAMLGIAMVSETQAATVVVKALSAHSAQIEGHLYSDNGPSKAKLTEISQRKPKPDIVVVAAPGTDFESFGQLIQLLQSEGFRVGFLTEPRPVKP